MEYRPRKRRFKTNNGVTKIRNQRDLICTICKKNLKSGSTLNRHYREVHNSFDYGKTRRSSKMVCPAENCNAVFMLKSRLNTHLSEVHQIELECEEYEFNCLKDFFKWKQSTENIENSTYVKTCGTKQLNDGSRKLYYLCHRALKGYSKVADENRKRTTKVGGSNKIGKACPSAIVATLFGKQVWVKYVKTHIGHDCEIGRQKISMQDKREIIAKLLSGMSFDEVIKSVRDSHECHSTRTLLLVKKDLHNIMRDYMKNSERFMEHCPEDDINSWHSSSFPPDDPQYDPEMDIYGEESSDLEFKPDIKPFDEEVCQSILTENSGFSSKQLNDGDVEVVHLEDYEDCLEINEDCSENNENYCDLEAADCSGVPSDSIVAKSSETTNSQVEETVVPSFNAMLQEKTELLYNLLGEVNITDQALATHIRRRLDLTIKELRRIVNPPQSSCLQ